MGRSLWCRGHPTSTPRELQAGRPGRGWGRSRRGEGGWLRLPREVARSPSSFDTPPSPQIIAKRLPPNQLISLLLTLFEGLGDTDKNCSRAASVMINCLLKERGHLLQEKVRRGAGPGGRGEARPGASGQQGDVSLRRGGWVSWGSPPPLHCSAEV